MENELLQQLGYASEQESAKALDVSVFTLRNWRTRGFGPPFCKAGSTTLYPVDGLRQYLLDNIVQPQPRGAPTLADPPRRPGRPRKISPARG